MMRKLIWYLTFVLVACNGGSSGEPREPAATGATGGEQEQSKSLGEQLGARTEDGGMEGGSDGGIAAAPAKPQATGQGKLTVEVKVGDMKPDAKVRVLDSTGSEVKSGKAGDTFTLPAGDYIIEADITDKSVLRDTPTESAGPVRLDPQQKRTETVEFGLSRVKLQVKKGNRTLRNVRVELKRQGSENVLLEYEPTGDYLRITPGRYDATVHWQDSKIKVDGVVFPAGGSRTIPIRVQ